MDDLTLYRIDSLLEHIDLVFNETNGLSIEEIEQNMLHKAICFSLNWLIKKINVLVLKLERF